MDKKIALLVFVTLVFVGCKKRCIGKEENIDIYPKLPDNVWLDSIGKGAKYNYFFSSTNGISDVLTAERTDFQYHMEHWVTDECAWVYYTSFRASFVSKNYRYCFDLRLDDANLDKTDEVQADYFEQPQYPNTRKYDKFIVDTHDTTKNRVTMVNYNVPDSTAMGHCSILPTYTTSAGITFNTVYKFTTLSAQKSFAQPYWIQEFYATKQMGIIEYTTKSGITFSFIRREKF